MLGARAEDEAYNQERDRLVAAEEFEAADMQYLKCYMFSSRSLAVTFETTISI